MSYSKILLFFLLLLFAISCAKEQPASQNIKKKTQELEMIEAYEDGLEKLNNNDTYNAAQKFLEAELLYPQSSWAPKSALMASYAYYLQNYYSEALLNLERYLRIYPKDKGVSYAHYLIGICYYEMIEDEKRDIEPLLKAKNKFELLIEDYPNTDFSMDSKFKLDLIEDVLASKEMYLARHYQKKNKWIAAINRYKIVVEKYDKTIYVEEALHRLVELYFTIGLENESQKYASLLGYNYQSSKWYEKSYKIFNKKYKSKLELKKEKKSMLKKFKKLFD